MAVEDTHLGMPSGKWDSGSVGHEERGQLQGRKGRRYSQQRGPRGKRAVCRVDDQDMDGIRYRSDTLKCRYRSSVDSCRHVESHVWLGYRVHVCASVFMHVSVTWEEPKTKLSK